MKIKKKTMIKDSIWSFFALTALNCVIQLLVYPFLRNILNSEKYGSVLFLLGVVNILSTALGSSLNLARLVHSVNNKTYNVDSLLWLFISCIVSLPVCLAAYSRSILSASAVDILLYWLIACLSIIRFYSDVEYRITTNYKGYFIYYCMISIGYLTGLALFHVVHRWQVILLTGEAAGIAYVFLKGSVLSWDVQLEKERVRQFFPIVVHLMIAQLLVNMILNSDRLVLNEVIGGEAVTIYYVSSLIGKTIALITTPLNSVLIGHLSKTSEQITKTQFMRYSFLALGFAAFLTVGCVLGSYIFVYLFYPKELESARNLFLFANGAQVLYFMGGILTTVLLRYISDKYQIVINVVYALLFVIIVIPAAYFGKISGFAIGLFFVNLLRFSYIVILGFLKISPVPESLSDRA